MPIISIYQLKTLWITGTILAIQLFAPLYILSNSMNFQVFSAENGNPGHLRAETQA
jgi:hypothetical protein